MSIGSQVFPECSASSISLGGPRSLEGMGKALHGIACEYNFVRVVVGMPPIPWWDSGPLIPSLALTLTLIPTLTRIPALTLTRWDSGPPPLHISVGSESSNGASGSPPS